MCACACACMCVCVCLCVCMCMHVCEGYQTFCVCISGSLFVLVLRMINCFFFLPNRFKWRIWIWKIVTKDQPKYSEDNAKWYIISRLLPLTPPPPLLYCLCVCLCLSLSQSQSLSFCLQMTLYDWQDIKFQLLTLSLSFSLSLPFHFCMSVFACVIYASVLKIIEDCILKETTRTESVWSLKFVVMFLDSRNRSAWKKSLKILLERNSY